VFSLAPDKLPGIRDLRNLEAPEPMEIILSAGAQLAPDDAFLVRLSHVPYPLFPHLEARGLTWELYEEEEGSVLILIRKHT
jgi:hypothetical protein